MKKTTSKILIVILISACAYGAFKLFFQENKPLKTSGALQALQWWTAQRAYPESDIPSKDHFNAFMKIKSEFKKTNNENIEGWKPIGPHNIGGRTLALAFNPQNSSTIYAGSASGGLWRSYTAGVGAEAWEYVPTGYPAAAVSSIAFAPNDSSIIYIGTGEVYAYQNSTGGITVRTTRGSYGIGLLKTSDAGITWTKCLDWTAEQQRGVQVVRVNPLNPNIVWAGTTEGTFKTTDAGNSWSLVHDAIMVTDLGINPVDTGMVWIACGNLNSEGKGVYRTTNGGGSWTKLAGGLPENFGGKIQLAVHKNSPNIIYASVGFGSVSNAGTQLCRSTDYGTTWNTVSDLDYATYQGWFSHIIGVHPTDPSKVICGGVDVFKSTSGGSNLLQKSYWYLWYFGTPPAGGPEGPPNYSHADHHAIVYHPENPNIIYFGNDGGVFRTLDGGETFEGCNGGYQSTQFYPGFSSSFSDSDFAMGGMQDNSTAIYEGGTEWRRVIGGDGAWSAINQTNNNIIYGSYQYLGLMKSTDKGATWKSIPPPGSTSNTGFIAPYVLANLNNSIIYAGRDRFYISTNAGNSWSAGNNNLALDGNPLLSIAVSPIDDEIIYASTAPVTKRAGLFYSGNGGQAWVNITGILPDRYPMDIAIHPQYPNTAYVVFSGFGTPHVYRTTNAGNSWENITGDLPDIPTSSIVIDPFQTNHIYVGNDLGVFISTDDGITWEIFNNRLPDAVIAIDLNISPLNRSLRVATHGNGVFERKLISSVSAVKQEKQTARNFLLGQNYPNPFNTSTVINYELSQSANVEITVFDEIGKAVAVLVNEFKFPGKHKITFSADKLPSGIYYYRLRAGNYTETKKAVLLK
jgi:photosystem II stability/assembly factor-like uncharacterized protein